MTIFGESAGGISVNMHMMSPLSQGYFHKAVSFSGTAVVPSTLFLLIDVINFLYFLKYYTALCRLLINCSCQLAKLCWNSCNAKYVISTDRCD